MTTKYDRGRNFEYIIRNWLIREGYYVVRSAGSHGAFDLVVFPLVGCNDVGLDTIHTFGIQLKGKNLTDITDTKLQQILNGKEFNEFKELKLTNVRKFVIMFNTRNVKQLPITFEYTDRWIRLDGRDKVESEITKDSLELDPIKEMKKQNIDKGNKDYTFDW